MTRFTAASLLEAWHVTFKRHWLLDMGHSVVIGHCVIGHSLRAFSRNQNRKHRPASRLAFKPNAHSFLLCE